jgi:hypothetical protein
MENKTIYDLRGLTPEQLQIIGTALDVYCRLSMGQFWSAIPSVPNVRRLMNEISMDESDAFESLILKAGNVITGMTGHGALGIHNLRVTDDARTAAHFYMAIKHQLWSDEVVKNDLVSSASPPDIVKDLKVDIQKRVITDDPEADFLKLISDE